MHVIYTHIHSHTHQQFLVIDHFDLKNVDEPRGILLPPVPVAQTGGILKRSYMKTDHSDFHFGCTHQYQLQLMNPIMTPVRNHIITKQVKDQTRRMNWSSAWGNVV